MNTALWRRLCALLLSIASVGIWFSHSDIIDLIVRHRPVLFNRYSQGHFGALIFSTLLLWAFAAAFAARKPLRDSLIDGGIGIVSTLIAILTITYAAHFFHRPARYIDNRPSGAQSISTVDNHLQWAGVVRHRPPNQVYDLTYTDKPEQARSYPAAPPGFDAVKIRLTSDANGFRNTTVANQYDIVAVGDSFVAGSNVSDEQCWTALLAQRSGIAIYNLGVGGSGPPTYLSNFAHFGLRLKPKLALFMIYEGNDFKEDVVLADPNPTLGDRISEHFDKAFHSSPVTLGLKRLSNEVFERIGADRAVPGYREQIGFMPIQLTAGGSTHHYSFEPKALARLNYSVAQFSDSREWQATARALKQIVDISHAHGIRPIFIYAPSTAHVLLPLVKDNLPVQRLRNFAAHAKRNLPPPEQYKQQLFANLDSEQQTVMNFCAQQHIDCLPLTDALRSASAAGRQVYYSYDQHWTPDGHIVAAAAIADFLQAKSPEINTPEAKTPR